MSKYIKLEDAIEAIEHDKFYTLKNLESLPTIEVSEDCISREYILSQAFASDEYNRETKSFDLPVVSVRDIEDAPSVVPIAEQYSTDGEVDLATLRAEGEWIDNHNGTFTCSECGNKHSKAKFCCECGAKMK